MKSVSIDEDEVGAARTPAPERSPDPVVATGEASSDSPVDDVPRWLASVLVVGLVWFAAVGVGGVLLLFAGLYHPAPVIVLATGAAVAAALTRITPRPGRVTPTAHWFAAGALVLAAGFSMFAGVYHSEHLLVDRDPAVYLNLGRTVADTHQLDPKTNGGPFDNRDAFRQDSPSVGVFDGRVSPGFFHMLPAVLAVAFSIGGDTGMLWVPAILGGLGLLALYALASKLVGPRWALAAPLLLAIAPLQLWFARDTYSELIVQPVVLGGLWLYLSARKGPAARAAVAGALIAAATFARVDALAFVACAFPLAALEWIRAPRRDASAGRRRSALAFVAGVAATTVVALVVTRSLSDRYIHALASEYRQLVAACVVAAVGSVAAIIVAAFAPRGLGRKIARSKVLFGAIVAGTALAFVYLATFRVQPASEMPRLLPRHQMTQALRTAINEWHWNYSLRWFFEYFGVIAIVAAVAGLLLLLRRALYGSGAATSVLCIVGPVTALYVWRPNISPDQPWAMRRYLPATLPAITIGVAVALAALWVAGRGRTRLWFRIATVVVALAVVIPTAIAARPFAKMRMQDGALSAMHQLCRSAGPDAAVLVIGFKFIDLETPATFRAFCNDPAAKPLDQKLDIPALAREWQERGRRLVLVTGNPSAVENLGLGAREIAHVVVPDAHEPERPTERRPRDSLPRPAEIWMYELPASATASASG
jgi:hypothetical protein